MVRLIFIVAIVSIVLFSCGESSKTKKSSLQFQNDFESVDGWFVSNDILKGNAYSGHYSTFANDTNNFSQVFSLMVGDLPVKPFSKVNISLQAKCEKTTTTSQLVLSIEIDGNILNWQGLRLTEFLRKSNEYFPVTTTFQLPPDLSVPENAVIKIYVWNTEKETVFADDFEISFQE